MHQQGKVVRVGCGAGYQGDRVPPAVELLKHANLDYLVLECLAERTLADSIDRMRTGGKGYDTRLKEWLDALLPIAYAKKVTIITNMGAADPAGAGQEAAKIAQELGIPITIAVARETEPGIKEATGEVGCTYLGADCLVEALSQGANLVIAGRVADPSLFVAPIAYSFGWDLKKDFKLIAQATLAGHLLECGGHLTGGYFAHPMGRNLTFDSLRRLSLPFCDVSRDGVVILRKLDGSGGEGWGGPLWSIYSSTEKVRAWRSVGVFGCWRPDLELRKEISTRTCKQQLTYEIGDPNCYMTPDVCVDFSKVSFKELSPDAVRAEGATATTRPDTLLRLIARLAGVKAFGEVAYGGLGCVERAQLAVKLVSHWMEEHKPGVMKKQLDPYPPEARVRFDGLFDSQADAMALMTSVGGLGLCGPAGGGGYTVGAKPDISITKHFIPREKVKFEVSVVTPPNKETAQRRASLGSGGEESGQPTTMNGFKVTSIIFFEGCLPFLLVTVIFFLLTGSLGQSERLL